jgi:hypothetical protein
MLTCCLFLLVFVVVQVMRRQVVWTHACIVDGQMTTTLRMKETKIFIMVVSMLTVMTAVRSCNGFSLVLLRSNHHSLHSCSGPFHMSSDDVEKNVTSIPSKVSMIETRQYSFDLTKKRQMDSLSVKNRGRRRRLRTKLRSWFRLDQQLKQPSDADEDDQSLNHVEDVYHFTYDCDVLKLENDDGHHQHRQKVNTKQQKMISLFKQQSIKPHQQQEQQQSTTTMGIILIHPIGVGIGRWFYRRLLHALPEAYALLIGAGDRQDLNSTKNKKTTTTKTDDFNSRLRYIVAVPDLLGSATACNATLTPIFTTTNPTDNENDPTATTTTVRDAFPLFNISDWTDQILNLMQQMEVDYPHIHKWAIVANGGCSPIALQVAARSLGKNDHEHVARNENTETTTAFSVTNVILSSVPRLSFFLSSTDRDKVHQSFKTLCGWPGRLFWWYACRNNGTFIQKFSEKNLVSDANNLGDTWQSDCYTTAVSWNGQSRYSTFSFLAGTLQDGCVSSLDTLKDAPVQIDIIRGKDMRRNRAKSWFWQRRKTEKKKEERDDDENDNDDGGGVDDYMLSDVNAMSFGQYIESNGNGGRETYVDGRISLAHEDAVGYADAVMFFLSHIQDW